MVYSNNSRSKYNHNKNATSIIPCCNNRANTIKTVVGITVLFMMFLNLHYNFNIPNENTTPAFKKDAPPSSVPVINNNNANLMNSDLDPAEYARDDGCDFSKVVSLFSPSNLEINCDNIMQLTRGRKLGSGYWRKVYEAEFHGRKVAMKLVRNSLLSRSDIVMRHVREASVLYQLRNEPNVVHLLGWCNSTVVVEYVPTLLEDIVFSKDDLPVSTALKYALDMAKGVAQLHAVPGGPFAHTDIQTRQMLINADGDVLLNDFNRMKYTGPVNSPSDWFSQSKNKIPIEEQKCKFRTPVAKGKWRAPEEYADSDQLDEKLDIYSLSMVMWTLRSREPPFEEYERDEVYKGVVEDDLRPSVEAMSDYPKRMQSLIQRGWGADPASRPSAAEMVIEIQEIINEL